MFWKECIFVYVDLTICISVIYQNQQNIILEIYIIICNIINYSVKKNLDR